MFRITILALAVCLLGACVKSEEESIVRPVTPTVMVPTEPAGSAVPPSAPKAPEPALPELSFPEYTEALFRVAGPYTFTISDRALLGAVEPMTVKVYKRDLTEGLVNLLAGGDMAGSVIGHVANQYEVRPFAKGLYQPVDGILVKLFRAQFSAPTDPADPMLCVSPKLLGGTPPKGYECCLLPPSPEYGWLLRLDTQKFCEPPFQLKLP